MSRSTQSNLILLLMLGIAFAAAFMSLPVNAEIYKCTINGRVTYSQSTCPKGNTADTVLIDKVSTPTPNSKAVQSSCSLANNFALYTAKAMNSGKTSLDLVKSFGGIDAVPSPALSIINYVYTFESSRNVKPENIMVLSAARCGSGAYGDVSCPNMPKTFIRQQGGCAKASKAVSFSSSTANKIAQRNKKIPKKERVERCQKDIASQLSSAENRTSTSMQTKNPDPNAAQNEIRELLAQMDRCEQS